MSFFDDIENDLNTDSILDNSSVNKLYGIDKFTDCETVDDLITHIVNLCHLDEVIPYVQNNNDFDRATDVFLPDLSKYNNEFYTIELYKSAQMYKISLNEPYKGIPFCMAFTKLPEIIIMKIYTDIEGMTFNFVDTYPIYNSQVTLDNIPDIIDDIKTKLKRKLDQVFINDNVIKTIKSHIENYRKYPIRIHPKIYRISEKLVSKYGEDLLSSIIFKGKNTEYKISIILLYILKDNILTNYISKLDTSNVLNVLSYINGAGKFTQILSILILYGLIDNIPSIFDFIDAVKYYKENDVLFVDRLRQNNN